MQYPLSTFSQMRLCWMESESESTKWIISSTQTKMPSNICFTTTQGLHMDMWMAKENGMSFDDF